MAKPVSEEELQLKKRARRRLLGAIVLVAAVAAILPMALDIDPKPTSQEINIQIPSPDAKGGFASKVVPLLLPAPAEKSAITPKPEATAQPAVRAPDAQKEAPVPKPDPEKAPEQAPPLKPGAGTFFIQVIALSDAAKAKQVQQKITDAGIGSYIEVVAAGAGKVTRVRAGPFATRDEAERARAQLAALGLEGKVAAQ